MEYRSLGRTGLRLPVLGLGCGGFGGVGSAPELFGKGEDRRTAFALMNHAWDAGINFFDTADSYGGGESERVIGAWLKERKVRDELILSCKFGYSIAEGPDEQGLSRTHIMRAIDGSLRRLQSDYIDLYVPMEPDPHTPEEETLTALNDLITAGKVRFIGASNVTAAQISRSLATSDRLGVARYQSIQNGYNLLDREIERELLPVAQREQLGVTPFGPTSGGLLTGKYQLGEPAPTGSRLDLRPQPYRHLLTQPTFSAIAALQTVAHERGIEVSTLALAWVLSHPAVTSALIGPRRVEHFRPLLEAVDVQLSGAEREALVDRMAVAA